MKLAIQPSPRNFSRRLEPLFSSQKSPSDKEKETKLALVLIKETHNQLKTLLENQLLLHAVIVKNDIRIKKIAKKRDKKSRKVSDISDLFRLYDSYDNQIFELQRSTESLLEKSKLLIFEQHILLGKIETLSLTNHRIDIYLKDRYHKPFQFTVNPRLAKPPFTLQEITLDG